MINNWQLGQMLKERERNKLGKFERDECRLRQVKF